MNCKRMIALFLCLILCFSGCATDKPQSREDLIASYDAAKAPVQQATALTLQVTYKLDRTVGGQLYSQSYTANISYVDLGKETMSASVSQNFKYGTFETEYAEYYHEGMAYCGMDDSLFSAAMTVEEFVKRQLPAVLADSKLYTNVTSHALGSDTVIVFSGATAPEGWVDFGQNAQLLSASATATLDPNGGLKQTAYVADFTADGVSCHLEATAAPSLALPQPQLPEGESIPIEYFDAPKALLQTVGTVFSSRALTATDQESLLCNAASLTQITQRTFGLYGSGADFMAKSEYSATITNYTGIPTTSSLTETFRDGAYSYQLNGNDPVLQPDMTAQKMRENCEDKILSGLFTPAHIQNAVLTDTGDFLYIHFTGNDTFVESLCSWIYAGLGADLNDYASSVTTDEAFGWLSIDKRTGLPTAIGQTLKLSHVITNVSYPLTYEYSVSLNFSPDDAYLTITGALPEEAAPETAATPLLYKVTGADGQLLWLLGTIHVGDNATAHLPKALTDALTGSDALAVEVNTDAFEAQLRTDTALQQQLALGYYYTDGTSAADHLDAEVYQRAMTMLRISGNYGYATARMKPALLENAVTSFLLQQTMTLSAAKGVEQRLMKLAQQAGLPVLDIEDPMAHALLITNYSAPLQAYLLKSTLDMTLSEYAAQISELYTLWCQGDEAALTQALNEDTSQLTEQELILYNEQQAALITDRNASMLQKALEYLESDQTVFFAVGLAHVLGEDGLAASLRDAGYTVEAVTYG